MNPDLQFIFSRRSIRKFTDAEIPETMLTDLLEAAMAAPSAVGRDPWHFIVLQSRDTLDRLASLLPHGRMLRQATASIVVCGDMEIVHDRQLSYLLQDLSAAVENLLLAANTLGLGGCWLGVHPREERMAGIRELFGLPEYILPVAGIALGWPAQQAEPRTRYNPDRVHREIW